VADDKDSHRIMPGKIVEIKYFEFSTKCSRRDSDVHEDRSKSWDPADVANERLAVVARRDGRTSSRLEVDDRRRQGCTNQCDKLAVDRRRYCQLS